MNQRDALQVGAAADSTAAIIRRARRQFWLLSAVTIVLWALVAVGAVAMVMAAIAWIVPPLTYGIEAGGTAGQTQLIKAATMGLFHATYVWALLLVAAAVSTVVLVASSRRATLRQIQISLAEITELIRRQSEK